MGDLSKAAPQHWYLTIVCRAVKVRQDQSETPGRKEFKAYKDRSELQFVKPPKSKFTALISDDVVQGSPGPSGPIGSTGPQGATVSHQLHA